MLVTLLNTLLIYYHFRIAERHTNVIFMLSITSHVMLYTS